MSTELKPAADLGMTRFSGGKRGTCLQLTGPMRPGGTFDFVSLRKDQAVELAHALLEFAMDQREEESE